MSSNGTSHLIFGPTPHSTFENAGPISVDTSTHLRQSNVANPPTSYNGYGGRGYGRGSSLRWNQAGISTSAERRLPFVHRFHDLPPPAGPARANMGSSAANLRQKALKTSTYETNPVGALQERFQSRGISPLYQVVQAEGASHCPTFTYQVFVHDMMASGSGSSKKQAKHAAARAMLDKLDGKESSTAVISSAAVSGTMVDYGTPVSGSATPVSISVAAQVASGQIPSAAIVVADGSTVISDAMMATDPTGVGINSSKNSCSGVNGSGESNGMANPVGLLQEFSVKHGLPMPVYDLGSVEGQPHQRLFQVICKVGVVNQSGFGSSKKEAKRKAATTMLAHLKDAGSGLQDLVFSSGGNITVTAATTAISKEEGIKSAAAESELSNRLQDLRLDGNSSKLKELQRTSLKSKIGDYVQLLSSIGSEQKFEVTYIELDERTDANEAQTLVQLSLQPVIVCYGVGKDLTVAKTDASRNALNYLKVMVSLSSGTQVHNNDHVNSNSNSKSIPQGKSNSSVGQVIEEKPKAGNKTSQPNGHRK